MSHSSEVFSYFITKNRTEKYLSAALISLFMMTWGSTYMVIRQQEQKALDTAALRSNNLANYFESRTAVTLRYADDYIKTVRNIYLQSGSFTSIRKYVAEIPPNTEIISHITILDANGVPLFSSAKQLNGVTPNVHARDREDFKFLKTSKTDSVYISVARKEPGAKQVTMLLARRITGPEGAFNGLIFAALKTSQLLNFSGTMLMGTNSSMTLVGLDKKIRLRRSQKGLDGLGKKIDKSKLWENLLKSRAGHYQQTSIIDKVQRLWTYRKVHGFPMIAVIGSASSDTLGTLTNIKRVYYTIATLINVIGIVIFFLAQRAIATTRLEAEIRERDLVQDVLLQSRNQLEQQNKLLEHLSITDPLTKIYNRIKLKDVLLNEFNRANRYRHDFGIIMVDVDHFKDVNDTHGHPVGDQVLIQIANLIKTHVRTNDTVGRWGGEEFLIISPETDQKGIMALAEKLRSRIESHTFPVINHKTASFGVAAYQQDDTETSIIARADEALYNAKAKGRNCVQILSKV